MESCLSHIELTKRYSAISLRYLLRIASPARRVGGKDRQNCFHVSFLSTFDIRIANAGNDHKLAYTSIAPKNQPFGGGEPPLGVWASFEEGPQRTSLMEILH